MLEVQNLTKYYGTVRGVLDLNFRVEAGEIFGFIGPNGAGKSTTIRCIMDILSRTSGEVLLDGRPFHRHTPKRKAVVGYLPSEVNLYGDMRVGALVRYYSSFYHRIDQEYVGRLLRRLAVDVAKPVRELSLGNRKKVGIVLALMHRPKLLLLDEASSGLDPLMQEAFYGILREERDRGTAILFSSHNLSEVRRLCDRVAIIREGEIAMVDTIENIVNGYVHRVTIECDDAALPSRLGAADISREGNTMTFLYEGEPDRLLQEMRSTHVTRLLVEEAPLEDVFMHFYR